MARLPRDVDKTLATATGVAARMSAIADEIQVLLADAVKTLRLMLADPAIGPGRPLDWRTDMIWYAISRSKELRLEHDNLESRLIQDWSYVADEMAKLWGGGPDGCVASDED